ncbi:MAG: hypothetical protein IPG56_10400 [Caulobacteraceae bacterium]|nr:hypothetical protein [Caulobacteraceae bacterium]
MKPIRGRSLITDRASAQFIDAVSVARAAHDWDAPALTPMAVSASAALAALPPETSAETNLTLPIGGPKLLRALARRAAPELKPDRAERLI